MYFLILWQQTLTIHHLWKVPFCVKREISYVKNMVELNVKFLLYDVAYIFTNLYKLCIKVKKLPPLTYICDFNSGI